MIVSSAKSLSVELDIDAIKPIVSGLRSHGEAVLAGLKNGEEFPTLWDSFKQPICDGLMAKGGGLEAGDLMPDWQRYTRVQTGSSEGKEMPSVDSPELFHRKIVAQIRDLLWGKSSLSFPCDMWESLGVAAWGSSEFQLIYADLIRSILRERYILSAEERKEVPTLSPNCFWLLLSLSPLGVEMPEENKSKSTFKEVPPNNSILRLYTYNYKYFPLETTKVESFEDAAQYNALLEFINLARVQSQQAGWAGFWDQWFLAEVFKQKGKQKFNFKGLDKYLERLPLFNDNPQTAEDEQDSLESSVSIPCNELKKTVPFWYANNPKHV